MYKIVRSILFLLAPETAHKVTFKILKIVNRLPLYGIISRSFFTIKNKKLEKEVFGIKFKNAVGLGAGIRQRCIVYK